MSRGRKAVSLEALQEVAGDGFETSVLAMLLGADSTRQVAVVPVWSNVTRDALRSPAVDETWYQKPADWEWRTTADDIRELVWEQVKARCPVGALYLAQCMVWGQKPHSDLEYSPAEMRQAKAAVKAARKVIIQTDLVKSPPRRGKVHASGMTPRPRWEGPCSDVTSRMPDGRVFVNGYQVKCLLPEDSAVEA